MLEKLQEQFGMPPTAGRTRAVPRVLFAYKGPRKPTFLAAQICMIVNGVLPDDGQKRSVTRRHTHGQLAQSAGLGSRTTWTRWMSLFSQPGKDAILPARCPDLIHKRRQFAAPNSYNTAIPELRGIVWVVYQLSTGKPVPRARYSGYDASAANERATAHVHTLNELAGRRDYEVRMHTLQPERFHYFTAEELMGEVPDNWTPEQKQHFEKIRDLFDTEMAEDFTGYKPVPEWVWHPALGISDTARLVLTYYVMCGILEKKAKGWLHVKQQTVSSALGISVRTVYNAHCELESVGLIRIVGQERNKVGDSFTGTPNKILFLPIRTMTDQEIAAERLRRIQARRALHETRKALRRRLRGLDLQQQTRHEIEQRRFHFALQACKAARVHRTAAQTFHGQTARITQLWAAAEAALLAAGIEKKLISALIPTGVSPPEPNRT